VDDAVAGTERHNAAFKAGTPGLECLTILTPARVTRHRCSS